MSIAPLFVRLCVRRRLVGRILSCRAFSSDDNSEDSISDRLPKPPDLRKPKPEPPKKWTEEAEIEETLGDDIVQAAENAACDIEDDPDSQDRIKSKLLSKQMENEKESYASSSEIVLEERQHIKHLLAGMKIDKRRAKRWGKQEQDVELSERQSRAIDEAENTFDEEMGSGMFSSESSGFRKSRTMFRRQDRAGQGLQLEKEEEFKFDGEDLGIFDKKLFHVDNTNLADHYSTMWRKLEQHRLELLSANAGPRNGFEEAIEWTKEGKMWPYPIDNEYQLGEELEVGFDEHILLEPLLDELGFPSSGPVRDYMHLVCVGLSKNPHITAARKYEHLLWHKEFFDEEKVQRIERLHDIEQKQA